MRLKPTVTLNTQYINTEHCYKQMDEAISARGYTCSASATLVKLLLDIPGLDTSVSKIQHVNITVVQQTKKNPSAIQKHSEFGCKI